MTFKDQYKPIIAHYFNYESLRYRIDDENTIATVKEEVKAFMLQFPLYPELG